MEGETTAFEDGKRRRQALVKWDHNLNTLIDSTHAYLKSTSDVLKQCPLNDTAPLQEAIADDPAVVSVPTTFYQISGRLFQVALAEEQIKLSRTALVARRNRMAKVSSVSRLPAELLALVFKFLVDKDDSNADLEWHTGQTASYTTVEGTIPERRIALAHPEIILTWVSRLWRDVALNQPFLWRAIDFCEEPPFVRSQKYLTRSQEVDLHVHFNIHNMPPRRPYLNKDIYLTTAIGTALPSFSRWNELSITTNTPAEMRQCFQTMFHADQPGNAKRIKSIHLHTDPKSILTQVFDEELAKFWLAEVDGLHTLSLKGVVVPWTWKNWFTNLSHLTLAFQEKSSNGAFAALDVGGRPLKTQFFAILKNCPRLETLDLTEFRFRDPPDATTIYEVRSIALIGAYVELPVLHTLKIRNCHSQSLHHLLSMIVAPVLHDFFFDIHLAVEPWVLSGILPFTERYAGPSSPVRKLWLSWFPQQNMDHAVTRMLRHLPNLEELVLQHGPVSDSMFKCLTPDFGGNAGATASSFLAFVCPNLKVMRLFDVVYSFTALLDMAEARSHLAAVPSAPSNNAVVLRLNTLQIRKAYRGPGDVMTSLVGETGTQLTLSELPLKRLMDAVDTLLWGDESFRPTPAVRDAEGEEINEDDFDAGMFEEDEAAALAAELGLIS